jgi:hypothetical protein
VNDELLATSRFAATLVFTEIEIVEFLKKI